MKEKHRNILQVILVIILIICALIFKVIPEYQETKGSSDTYIDTDTYTDIVEIKINNKPNFAIVTTEKTISNILFFDQESLCLYNQDIEGTTIQEGTKKIIELLIENDYLKQNYFLTLTNYKNTSYESIKSGLLNYLTELNVVITLQEETSSITSKAKSLNITTEEETEQLKEIELTSKDIVRHYNNNVSGTSTITKTESITDDSSRDYTDTVYKKIENYVRQNNIINQDVSASLLDITQIPANTEGTIFPDSTSWYYVQDGNVFAYISITQKNTNYSYCYQASIDVYKKGQC